MHRRPCGYPGTAGPLARQPERAGGRPEGLGGLDWCAWSNSNGHCVRALNALPCWLGYRRVKNEFGGPGWIQTNAGRAPGRLRGGCRRSLGYWSRSENVEFLEDTVGLAPTMRRLRASRVKSPVRSLLRSRVRNAVCLCCSCLFDLVEAIGLTWLRQLVLRAGFEPASRSF
jgi:hypothetical protein